MKNTLKFALVFAIIAFGFATFIASKPSSAAEYVESSTVSRALYRTHCASCHGNDGKSNTKKGRETEASDLTDAGVKGNATDKNIRIITNGKGEMPGMKGKLSSSQIASIARYIKTL